MATRNPALTQLRLVVYPIIYDGFYTAIDSLSHYLYPIIYRVFIHHLRWLFGISSINSIGGITRKSVPSQKMSCHSGKKIGVSKNRGTPKWMVYNGKPY